MRLDTRTLNTLRKAVPAMFQEDYSKEDARKAFKSMMEYSDEEGVLRLFPEELKSEPDAHVDQMATALLKYAASDAITLPQYADELTDLGNLIPVAWGVFCVKKQTRILTRLHRPLNHPEGIYYRGRDVVIRACGEESCLGGEGNFRQFQLIAKAFKGYAPCSLTEFDIV